VKAVIRLPNNKASLDIPAEEFTDIATYFYQDIWKTQAVPDYFGKGEISAQKRVQ
jgi:hypothetical protein